MQGKDELSINEELYIEALAHHNAMRFKPAIEAWQELIAEEPRFALAHFNLGQMYDKLDQVPDALPCYERAVQLVPDNGIYRLNLGSLYLRQGMARPALAELREALTRDPYNFLIDYNLAGAYLALNDHDNALIHADKAVDLYSVPGPNESGLKDGVDREMLTRLLARQAECHVVRGEMDKARQCVDRIVNQCRTEVPVRLQTMLDKTAPGDAPARRYTPEEKAPEATPPAETPPAPPEPEKTDG